MKNYLLYLAVGAAAYPVISAGNNTAASSNTRVKTSAATTVQIDSALFRYSARDSVSYTKGGIVKLYGNSQFSFKGNTISADLISFDKEKMSLEAKGNVTVRNDSTNQISRIIGNFILSLK